MVAYLGLFLKFETFGERSKTLYGPWRNFGLAWLPPRVVVRGGVRPQQWRWLH